MRHRLELIRPDHVRLADVQRARATPPTAHTGNRPGTHPGRVARPAERHGIDTGNPLIPPLAYDTTGFTDQGII